MTNALWLEGWLVTATTETKAARTAEAVYAPLPERTHRCSCGCVLDRDVASAMVVHQRAFGRSPGMGVGSLIERVAA